MFRLVIFILILSLHSCATSRSINHFASKRRLSIKEVENISLFNGRIETEDISKKGSKEFVYLLYDNDTLSFVSNNDRITNNDFIYKLSHKTDSIITLTRATMEPRYYTVDTLLFGSDFALEKRCLYDDNKIVQFYFTEYKFSNDSLNISSYQFDRDVMPISFWKNASNTISEIIGKPKEVKSYANQEKRTFFKKHIN